ncbi:sensor domain-containing diguanylate cyclase [Sporosarcina sp. CAU 1771]
MEGIVQMDERLNYAPCGYFSLSDNGTILSINETLLKLLGYDFTEVHGLHIDKILTVQSRLFYQLYFFPLIQKHEKVDEMYLTLQTKDAQDISVFLNAVRIERDRKKVNDCIIIPMQRRTEYEHQLLGAKKKAEEAQVVMKQAIVELNQLRLKLEENQKELLELNSRLEIQATTDELTGLENRRSFQQNLEKNIDLTLKSSQPLSLLFLDIDDFKKVNDTFGHLIGDKVLQNFAKLLKVECEEGMIAARYGGDEFALILPNKNEQDSLIIAERIRSSVERSYWIEIPITTSIGIETIRPNDTLSMSQSRADQALYSSKRMGRNQVTHANQL